MEAVIFTDDRKDKVMIANFSLDEPSLEVVVFIDNEIRSPLKVVKSDDLFVNGFS